MENGQTGSSKRDRLTIEISKDLGMRTQSFAEERQRQWRAFINREKMESGEVDNFPEVIQRLKDFLLPVVDSTLKTAEFDEVWSPAEGWSKF